MLTDNLILLATIAIALAILIIVQFFFAARHDHVVSSQGRIATLEALDTQIAAKRTSLTDMDADLAKRREALASLGDMGAEADALRRQRDELLTEWNALSDKREELREIREETELAWTKHQTTTSEVAEAKDELERVRARLDRAEELVGRTEELERQHAEWQARVAEMEVEAKQLAEAQAEVERLTKHRTELETEIAAVDGRLQAKEGQLEETSARLVKERDALMDIRGEWEDARTELAVAGESLSAKRKEIEELDAKHSRLEARTASIEERIEEERRKLDGGSVDNEKAVDDRMKQLNVPPPVLSDLSNWSTWNPEGEVLALKRVEERFKAVGLNYHPRILRAFHTSMKVNETTQMTILAGISGTGKSQLPRQYAAGMGIGFLQVPVQPRWDSPQDLMGFYNYIEGRFRPTDMARALWQLDTENNRDGAIRNRMMMILLDEMNLARVEYYFSDFLSRLETRPPFDRVGDKTLRKDAELELEIPMPKGYDTPRVFPGYNLLFAGTMNEDESTQSLSDKVVDRANLIRFAAPKRIESGDKAENPSSASEALEFESWRTWVRPTSTIEKDGFVQKAITRMSDLMKGFQRPFGHRLGRAIMAYVANYPETPGSDRIRDALADQVEMRLLPKLRGIEMDDGSTDSQFEDLRDFVANDLDDRVLADAIESIEEVHKQGTGQFVWTGVTRS